MQFKEIIHQGRVGIRAATLVILAASLLFIIGYSYMCRAPLAKAFDTYTGAVFNTRVGERR